MSSSDRMDRLNAVAAHLPFAVEDYAAVNETFGRWAAQRRDEDLKTIEVWLYCYVHRYVYTQLLAGARRGGGEPDRIVEEVFCRARDQLGTVAEPAAFTFWVHRVCRNTFLNGLRRRYPLVNADEDALDVEVAPEPELSLPDRALIHDAFARALASLPEKVRTVARMRFLEDHSYAHIAAATGAELPTVRTYAARAVQRLRAHPELRALGRALDLVPP
jgi:RNA polymerase sigma factor (sigma-70 family)